MELQWLNAVIDLPAERFDEAGAFWVDVSATTRGAVHPEHDEFVHLNPAEGDMHLELQRLSDGPAAAHLDLVVDDIPGWKARALSAGATVIAEPGHVVLCSPGGVRFCIVPHGEEAMKAPAITADLAHAVDQICLDVPHDLFDDDVAFWAELTGWSVNEPQFPEFRSFAQPPHLPLRLLVQRLGVDDVGGGRSHLDISSGDHVDEVTERHVARGATVVERHRYWTALRDPAGMPYCITSRPPDVG